MNIAVQYQKIQQHVHNEKQRLKFSRISKNHENKLLKLSKDKAHH